MLTRAALGLLILASSIGSLAQTSELAPSLENDFARVYRLTLPADGSVRLSPGGVNYVVVPLNEMELSTDGDAPMELRSGEPVYLSPSSKDELHNTGDVSAALVVVWIKRKWEVPVRSCTGPSCLRTIRMGSAGIGETETPYTNGFLTVYRHQLDRGATLDSSYYSAKGVDRMIFVPVTELDATFDAISEHLLTGQPYATSAAQVEVSAHDGPTVWVVIRLHDEK